MILSTIRRERANEQELAELEYMTKLLDKWSTLFSPSEVIIKLDRKNNAINREEQITPQPQTIKYSQTPVARSDLLSFPQVRLS